MAVWTRRRAKTTGAPRLDQTRPAEDGAARPLKVDEHPNTVIDLTDSGPWAARIQADPARAAEMADRARRRREQADAAAELQRLRTRHWSGERLIEEALRTEEWWEHPAADPHAVLELVPGASLSEAAAARRRIAKECHPDRTYDSDVERQLAQRRMIAANAAYDRLRRALIQVS